MSIVKSLSVGDGDMFYIKHNSDNFSIIDCCMSEDDQQRIVSELENQSSGKGVVRFISSHPDNDHILGLDYLDRERGILNFYCVRNAATKEEITDDFRKYCELRDSDKAFYLFSGCKRRWMNQDDEERKSAGIKILWPETENEHYKQALRDAADGKSPNNISPIVEYSLQDGVTMLWMGDLESGFMENIKDNLVFPQVDVLFAPHHGRDTGRVPEGLLSDMSPRIVVIGEAPSEHINYYQGYNTITQNSAGDITFECVDDLVHLYVSKEGYSVDYLDNQWQSDKYGHYIGTLKV